MAKELKRPVTLCWACKNAYGGCSWADELIPVRGWKAKPTTIGAASRGDSGSYIVMKCPHFWPEEHLCDRCLRGQKDTPCEIAYAPAGSTQYVGYCSFYHTSEIITRKPHKKHAPHNGSTAPRRVIQRSLAGEYLQTFGSYTEASKAVHVSISCISKACKGQRHTAGGFKWELAPKE